MANLNITNSIFTNNFDDEKNWTINSHINFFMSNSLINNTYGNIKCLSDIIFISPIQVSELPDDMIITFTINGKNYNTTKNQHDYVKIEEHFNTPEKQVVEVKYPNWTNIIQLNYNVTENT